jgi:hypothetical protein
MYLIYIWADMICGVFIRFRAKLGEKKAAVLADGCFEKLLLC